MIKVKLFELTRWQNVKGAAAIQADKRQFRARVAEIAVDYDANQSLIGLAGAQGAH